MKEISYEVKGEGKYIVLLHGNGENRHIFDKMVDLLKEEYCCVSIDTRYHGQSVKTGKVSYNQFCQDVMNVIDELNIKEYGVIGFSDGAIISILLSLHDKRITHQVLIGANVRVKGLKLFTRINDWLMLFCLIPFCIYNKKMRIKWKLIKLMETMKEIKKEELNRIQIPSLVMAGEYDLIKEEETHYISENIKYSVERIIKNGSHFLLSDNFKETYDEIKMFLDAFGGKI
jgi:pimeloyl-ACP methyl ester carboxylesterase